MEEVNANVKESWWKRRWFLSGVLLGALYGVALRVLFGSKQIVSISTEAGWVMTLAFLVFCPVIVGVITISECNRARRTSFGEWILLPWAPILIAFLLAVLARLEGFICVVMALPVCLAGASLGGLITGIALREDRELRRSTVACFALGPMLLAPLEQKATFLQIRTVHSEISIHASAATVWKNIERVPTITSFEIEPTWTQRLGFPRPLEATLSYEGVGGVRQATFERGLRFEETVTDWQPGRKLAFRIHAKTKSIPTTTLDEHVTIGGRFFDVLDGEYYLEPKADGQILLHLTSRQRLSTDFNGYAGLWTDAVMQSLQSSILKVIQHRCDYAQPTNK